MLDIQKAIVKYRDRSDYTCFYTDINGVRYYIMEGGTLENGNMIASTELVEVIDPMVAASSVGVLSPEGEIVIPFNNKSIKQINSRLLLVEASKPISKSVSESLALRSDPLAATRLVNTAATIKERMNEKLGANGRYILNDQFSEGTLDTTGGKNVVNGEYYSYIGMNADNIYLSKNTTDSKIVEYALNAPVRKDDIFATAPKVEPDQQLDLNRVVVDKKEIDDAIKNETVDTVEDKEEILEDEAVEEKSEITDIPQKDTKNNVVAFPSIPSVSTKANVEELAAVQPTKIVENNIVEFPTKQKNASTAFKEDSVVEKDGSEFDISDQKLEEVEEALLKEPITDTEDVILAKEKHRNLESSKSIDYYGTTGDSIFQDAATTISGLIAQNKSLQDKNNELENKNKELEERNDVLETRISATRTKFIRYEKAVGSLEVKVQQQAELINDQEEEITQLRQQLTGQQGLGELLDEARALLAKDSSYQESPSHGRKAA